MYADKPVATLAYAAGLLDGEGSVQLERRSNGWMPVLSVAIYNTDATVIDWLKSEFGGVVYLRDKVKAHHKISYMWKLNAKIAGQFLEAVIPYMIIKKRQAELGLAMRAMAGRRSQYVPPEKLAKAEGIVGEIRALNKRGRPIAVGETKDT